MLAYDYRQLMQGENPIVIANQWGKDGWRWINPPSGYERIDAYVSVVRTMIFEKRVG